MLPMIIFAVITVVLIIMFFYSQITDQCRLHIAIRSEAGAATGRTVYFGEDENDFNDEIEIYTDKKLTGCEVNGKKYLIMKYKGILEKKGVFLVTGKCTGTERSLCMEQGIQGILCSKGDTEPVFDQDPAGVWLRL